MKMNTIILGALIASKLKTLFFRLALYAVIATLVVASSGTTFAEDSDCLCDCGPIQTYPPRPGGNPLGNAGSEIGVVTENPFCFGLRAPHNLWFRTQAGPGTLKVDICDVRGGVGIVDISIRQMPDWPLLAGPILRAIEFRRPNTEDSWTVELAEDDFVFDPCEVPLVVLFQSSGGGVMTFKVSFTEAECH